MTELIIEELNGGHNRPSFVCGNPSLDTYLKRQASQDVKRSIARVYVATKPDNESDIVGYYTLSTLSIDLSALPSDLLKKLPRHPLPAALIGRLAVSEQSQGQRIGALLLVDAIKRTIAVSLSIGIYAVVVDAIDESAAAFYQKFGFIRLAKGDNRWFLPLTAFID